MNRGSSCTMMVVMAIILTATALSVQAADNFDDCSSAKNVGSPITVPSNSNSSSISWSDGCSFTQSNDNNNGNTITIDVNALMQGTTNANKKSVDITIDRISTSNVPIVVDCQNVQSSAVPLDIKISRATFSADKANTAANTDSCSAIRFNGCTLPAGSNLTIEDSTLTVNATGGNGLSAICLSNGFDLSHNATVKLQGNTFNMSYISDTSAASSSLVPITALHVTNSLTLDPDSLFLLEGNTANISTTSPSSGTFARFFHQEGTFSSTHADCVVKANTVSLVASGNNAQDAPTIRQIFWDHDGETGGTGNNFQLWDESHFAFVRNVFELTASSSTGHTNTWQSVLHTSIPFAIHNGSVYEWNSNMIKLTNNDHHEAAVATTDSINTNMYVVKVDAMDGTTQPILITDNGKLSLLANKMDLFYNGTSPGNETSANEQQTNTVAAASQEIWREDGGPISVTDLSSFFWTDNFITFRDNAANSNLTTETKLLSFDNDPIDYHWYDYPFSHAGTNNSQVVNIQLGSRVTDKGLWLPDTNESLAYIHSNLLTSDVSAQAQQGYIGLSAVNTTVSFCEEQHYPICVPYQYLSPYYTSGVVDRSVTAAVAVLVTVTLALSLSL